MLEREVPETLRLLQADGVKLLHFGPPVAMGVEHEITPDGGGKAIVEALASSLEKTGAADILYRTEAVQLSLADTAASRASWSAARTACCARSAHAR